MDVHLGGLMPMASKFQLTVKDGSGDGNARCCQAPYYKTTLSERKDSAAADMPKEKACAGKEETP